jgi:Peptidase family M28
MLDPRIYRAALIPIVFALIVAAFSLSDRPRPIGTTLVPDAFNANATARAFQDLDTWVKRYPARRAGDSGDAQLANELAKAFRGMGSYQVSTPSFEAETADGKRTLTTVIARQVGQPGPGLVVVAHRDALGRGARAELSGTAALVELARLVRGGRLHRTVTFVSTSGGSAGLGGARDLVNRLDGPTDAVLVLGDLAGTTTRRPFAVGWSTGDGVGSLQLRRTIEAAVRKEAGTNPGGAHATSQWARLAFPVTVAEQGPLVAADLPAALLSISGERAPGSGDRVEPKRLQTFGRAALRTLTAVDNAPDLSGAGASRSLVTVRKVLPLWAVRLLVAAFLLAPVLVTVDGFARVRRHHHAVAPWLWWLAGTAAPLFAALVFCWFLGLVGLLPATPPEPVAAGAIPIGGSGIGALIAMALMAALAWLTLRPAILRRARVRGRLEGDGAGAALLVMWCALAGVLWVTNPYAAALMVPGAHVLLAVVSPEVRLRRGLAVGLIVLAAVPFALVDLSIAGQLGLSPGDFAWFCTLLVAGGIVGPLGWAIWSLVLVCLVAALMLALRGRPAVIPEEPRPITVRGPVGYAGPGSLGGTESALRRAQSAGRRYPASFGGGHR